MSRFCLLMLLFVIAASHPLYAHEVRPGFLGLEEYAPGEFDVIWKQPVAYQRRLPLEPVLPVHCAASGEGIPHLSTAALIQRWRIDCGEDGLAGATIAVNGLSVTLTDVLLRVDFLNDAMTSHVLKPGRPTVVLLSEKQPVVPAYLTMGIRNLLSGLDHMLFVVALLLAAPSRRKLAGALIAFSCSLILTLMLSSMNVLRPPRASVDAAIALTLVYIAIESLKPVEKRSCLVSDYLWQLACCFGLIHGFGFAEALGQIGLPPNAPLQAVVLYSLGIGAGMAGVVGAAYIILLIQGRLAYSLPAWVFRGPVFGIGCLGVYWAIDRSVSILSPVF